VSRMSGAPACSRFARESAPLSTPATIPAPARSPDSTSLAVSPATASSLTAPPCKISSALSGRSGHGRPRPASAGDRARSIRSPQPSSEMMASRVVGEKPVARQTRMPASRQVLNTSAAPGMAAT
jgi:hypothetical protein